MDPFNTSIQICYTFKCQLQLWLWEVRVWFVPIKGDLSHSDTFIWKEYCFAWDWYVKYTGTSQNVAQRCIYNIDSISGTHKNRFDTWKSKLHHFRISIGRYPCTSNGRNSTDGWNWNMLLLLNKYSVYDFHFRQFIQDHNKSHFNFHENILEDSPCSYVI